MKIFQNVRSTATNIPSVEVNVDTVYVRSDIKRVEEMEFSGWEYNEIQYSKDKYIEKLTSEEDLGSMAMLLSITLSEVDMLKSMMGGM